ncbi:uncharacterized protein LOC9630013 [Selaginella moellendorffii]|nr:uncharacterized protein LOC9630013 [Selaginella moellendorffii]|eukprot:XP_024536412.1 uncharacterized protein LOC9630013 [Selaginella moellendorffii]
MMTRMTAVAPKERISSGLSSVIRERNAAAAGPSRRDKLLGISPGSSPSPLSMLDPPDSELREEDVWGGDENSADDLDENQPSQQQPSARFLKSGRQWLGLESSTKEQASPLGLSSINRPSAKEVSTAAPVRKSTTASRMIPQVSSFDHPGKMIQQQSAPVNIPDWSKILGIDKRGGKENGFDGSEEPEEVEEAEDEWQEEDLDPRGREMGRKKNRIPPHELAAREYAKSHTAFSVYEGAGRTLKGMDLRRVRNAVWMQTGFLGG